MESAGETRLFIRALRGVSVRLVQVTIPAGKRDALLSVLDDEGIDYVVTDEASGREYVGVVYFPIPTVAVEPVLESLREVGIDTQVRTMDWPTYVGTMLEPPESNTTQLHLLGWAPSYMDSAQQMEQFQSGQHPPNGLATSFYENPEVDGLIDEAARELDPDRRASLYGEAGRQIWEDAPWIFLWVQSFPMVHSAEVTNIGGFPNEKFDAIYARPAD